MGEYASPLASLGRRRLYANNHDLAAVGWSLCKVAKIRDLDKFVTVEPNSYKTLPYPIGNMHA